MHPLVISESTQSTGLLRATEWRLIACRLEWLTSEQAIQRQHVLRKANALVDLESSKTPVQLYRTNRRLLGDEEVKPFLDSLVQARMAKTTRAVDIVDQSDQVSLTYWGAPLLSRHKVSGKLIFHSELPYSLVQPSALSRVREDLALTWMACALAAKANVPPQAVLVPMKSTERFTESRWAGDTQGALLYMQGMARLIPKKFIRLESVSATRALRDHILEPAVAALARQATSACFALRDYNRVLAHRALYERVSRESPTFLPLLHKYILGLPAYLQETDLTAELAYVDQGFDQLRSVLREQPFASKQYWKFLLKLSRGALKSLPHYERRPLPRFWQRPEDNEAPGQQEQPEPVKAALDRLAQNTRPLLALWLMGLEPEALSKKDVLKRWAQLLARLPVQTLAAAKTEQRRRLGALLQPLVISGTEVHRDGIQVLDWLREQGLLEGRPIRTDNLDTLRAAAHTWHQIRREGTEKDMWERQARAILAKSGRPADLAQAWGELVPAYDWEGVRIRPLNTPMALWEEHRSMRHCVDAYLSDCLEGSCRLFHLHEVARPKVRSTLELAIDERGWYVRQHAGPVNSPVPEHLLQAGQETLRRANQLSLKSASPL